MISALALVVSLIALAISLAAAGYAVRHSSANLGIRALAKLETELTELTDAHVTLRDSIKKLRSRIGMRELRARKNGAQVDDVEQDDYTTEVGRTRARVALEAKLAQEGRLNSRAHTGG